MTCLLNSVPFQLTTDELEAVEIHRLANFLLTTDESLKDLLLRGLATQNPDWIPSEAASPTRH
jgi:hypothetical protein